MFIVVLIGGLASWPAAQAEKRVALVIGNSAYQHTAKLANPSHDAKAVAAALRRLDFDVVDGYDLNINAFRSLLSGFGRKAADADVATVYYAGHALQVNGTNYVLPVDARLAREQDLNWQAIPMNFILDELAGAKKLKMVLLDACRDNPLANSMSRAMGSRSSSVGRGLAVIGGRVSKTLIAYATGAGDTASDGAGKHSPFTKALLANLETPGLEIRLLFGKVSDNVRKATSGRQEPYVYTSLGGDAFYLKPGTPAAVSVTSSGADKEALFWQSIQHSKQASDYEAYLSQYPNGSFAALARSRAAQYKPQQVASLPPEPQPAPRPSYRVQMMDETLFAVKTANVRSEPSATSDKLGLLDAGRPVGVTGRTEVSGATWYRVALANGEAGYVYGSLLDEREPLPIAPIRPAAPVRTGNLSPGDIFRDCENAYVATAGRYAPSGAFCGPEMVVIPSGSFQMGSNDGYDNEKPVHRVNIGYQFAVGKYEVTQAEWQAVMGSNPSYFKGSNRPVENVYWIDTQTFIQKLNRKTGQRYRLLSESEWEYVARAGTTTTYSWGNSAGSGNANCDGCGSRWDNKETAPVGSFRANPFGVHDMHGNVWEWTEDCWNDSYANAPSDGSAREGNNSCNRVLRGGSWYGNPWVLRSAYRSRGLPDYRNDDLGFRLARTL
ncbi:hypothetical protein JCM17960_00420 [Magnetospira thiophila]